MRRSLATERKTARLQPPRDVAAFLRTGAVSLSVVVSGERLSQAANCLQLLVFDHCHCIWAARQSCGQSHALENI
jgi:hypothetical protein